MSARLRSAAVTRAVSIVALCALAGPVLNAQPASPPKNGPPAQPAATPPPPAAARLEAARVERNGEVRVLLPTGLAAGDETSAAILLERTGNAPQRLNATVEKATADRAARVTATIPDTQPFGDYDVIVLLDRTPRAVMPRLAIVPTANAQVHLAELSPPDTYRTETTYVPDGVQSRRVAVQRLRLRDTAITDRSRITVVGADVLPSIVWNDCDPSTMISLPTESRPADAIQVYGSQKDGAVELCRVPETAKPQIDFNVAPVDSVSGVETAYLTSRTGGGTPRQTVSLVLRGSGFLVERAAENEIWIDGVRQRVEWDDCERSVLASRTAPRPLQIHGQVVSSEEIRLCGIGAPAAGEMRIAVGFGDTQSETRRFAVYSMTAASVTWRAALIATLFALIPLALLSCTRHAHRIKGEAYRYLGALFLDPETNTYSLSKLQFYLWTVAALFGYAYLFISRVRVQNAPWPDVPGTLPGIIAVSLGTAVGSQVVTAVKGSKGAGDEEPSLADLIVSGGVVAADRVQMLVWTVFGVGAFVTAIVHLGPGTIGDLPAVPENLLYLMGLSSTGYLAGKMARKAGPVMTEIFVTPSDSDDNLARAAGSVALPDFGAPLADARTVAANLATLPATAHARARDAVAALQQGMTAAASVRSSGDLAELATSLERQRLAAEAALAEVIRAESATPPAATAADASAAQQAAAALQQLGIGVVESIAAAAALQMDTVAMPARADRTIEIRGTNLSPDALLEIDHVDLPFRMITSAQGQHAPDIVARDATNPTFARVLRLSILRSALESSDQQRTDTWFSTAGTHTFTLMNPDGQKAELTFKMPPAESQKAGTT